MAHGTEHHLQEAEHAHHHAQDPFDRRVAMTMAILAAVLAGVTMASHRAHNETLRLQNEALAFQSEANKIETQVDTLHTKASDKWGYYQAKKNRLYQYEALADLVGVLPKDAGRSPAASSGTTDDPKGASAADQLAQNWKGRANKYSQDANNLEKEARQLEAEAEHKRKEIEALDAQVEHKKEESVEVHHRANRLDYGHLGLELALVICSVAVLTKQRGFWFTGIGVGLVGALVAATSFLMH